MSNVVAAKKAANATIGGMTDTLVLLREKKRVHEEEIKKLEAEFSKVSEDLMTKLDAEGTDKGAGKRGSCSITSSVVGNVTDWDALNKYIKRTGYFQLYQRRVSDAAVRELFESKGAVPGVEPFTKRRLNLRAA
jgi:ATP-dependent phosphoenolpyruvate carboxykinase